MPINANLARMADGKTVRFLDVNERLADKDGRLFEGMMHDRLHPTEQGYQVWADGLKPVLTELLGPRAAIGFGPAADGRSEGAVRMAQSASAPRRGAPTGREGRARSPNAPGPPSGGGRDRRRGGGPTAARLGEARPPDGRVGRVRRRAGPTGRARASATRTGG